MLFILIYLISSSSVFGQEVSQPPSSPYQVSTSPERPRKFLLPPLASFLLPGFDQYLEGQYGYASTYTDVAVGGIILTIDGNKPNNSSDLDTRDDRSREAQLGGQLYQASGGLSAYHSFRSAVRTRQKNNEFMFLKKEETPLDILKAPFHFEYLTKPTTYIPLALELGLLGYEIVQFKQHGQTMSGADLMYASSFSYNAGTHEEAVFRGYIMPVAMYYENSEFWSNATQSILFAAAHLSTNSEPWPQLALGYYLGYISQKNDWTISEGIFIHAWWDAIAFLSSYGIKGEVPSTFWFPLVQLSY